MSKLLELGGKSRIILRALCDFDTTTRHFNKGDIVFSSMETEINITDYENNKQIFRDTNTVLAINNTHFNNIVLSSIPVTTDLLELFCDEIDSEYDKLVIDNVYLINGVAYATNLVDTTQSFSILNHNEMTLVYNSENNSFTISSTETIDENIEYQLCYYSKKQNFYYSINNKNTYIPYLSFEALIKGNKDKEETEVYVFIQKVRLRNNLVLNTKIGNIAYYTISLDVIEEDKNSKKSMLGL